MTEDSDDLNFIAASEKEILKDAEEAAKLQKKDNDFIFTKFQIFPKSQMTCTLMIFFTISSSCNQYGIQLWVG